MVTVGQIKILELKASIVARKIRAMLEREEDVSGHRRLLRQIRETIIKWEQADEIVIAEEWWREVNEITDDEPPEQIETEESKPPEDENTKVLLRAKVFLEGEIQTINKKLGIKDEPVTKRGRKPSAATVMATEMKPWCTLWKGSDNALYMELNHLQFKMWNGIYQLEDVEDTMTQFIDAISNIYENLDGFVGDKALIDSALQSLIPNMRPRAKHMNVAVRNFCFPLPSGEYRVRIDLGLGCTDRILSIEKGKEIWYENSISAEEVVFKPGFSYGVLPKPDLRSTFYSLERPRTLDEQQWKLYFLWLVRSSINIGLFTHLSVVGPTRSGKSVLLRYARNVLDPRSKIDTEVMLPSKVDALMAYATRVAMLAQDNIDKVNEDILSTFCTIAVNGEIPTRSLYSNNRLKMLSSRNVAMVTSMNDVMIRTDAKSRMLQLYLPAREEEDRKMSDSEITEWLQHIQPQVFGAVVNAIQGALEHISSVPTEGLSQLADFERWSLAIGRGLGWEDDEVRDLIDHYRADRISGGQLNGTLKALQAYLNEFAEPPYIFEGTSTHLLELLRKVATTISMEVDLPKAGNALSAYLRAHTDVLKKHNIIVWDYEKADHKEDWNTIVITQERHPRRRLAERLAARFGSG